MLVFDINLDLCVKLCLGGGRLHLPPCALRFMANKSYRFGRKVIILPETLSSRVQATFKLLISCFSLSESATIVSSLI